MTSAPLSAHQRPAAHRHRRAVAAALAAVGLAAVLSGCGSTPGTARSSDPAATSQQGESGITVFGDIDVNVTKQRTR